MSEEPRQWRVRPTQAVLKAAAAVACTVMAVLSHDDRSFLLLAGIGTVALAGFALRDLLVPVRLAADSTGVTVVRGLAGRRHLPWSEIERIRVYESRRYGLRARLLEIDTGHSVHLFGAGDLGAQPEEVMDRLRAMRVGA